MEKCLAVDIGLPALEDAISDGGLADYEVRGYIGWKYSAKLSHHKREE